jgi:hypothetical protein
MSGKSSPWFEGWYIKLLVIACGGGLLYLGQIRYEKNLKADESRKLSGGTDNSDFPRFTLLGQLDFSGESLATRRRQMATTFPESRLSNADDAIARFRGIFCLVLPGSTPGPLISEGVPVPTRQPDWSFEISGGPGPAFQVFPLPSPPRSFLTLCVPFETAKGIEHPILSIKRDGEVLSKISLHQMRALTVRSLGDPTPDAPVTISPFEPDIQPSPNENPRWVPNTGQALRQTRYVVQLKKPAPPGPTAFVRLMRTEYADNNLKGWTEIRNSRAIVSSPSGLLAKTAEIRVAFGIPKRLDKTVTAPLGRIVVQYGQPTFFLDKPESISLTKTSSMTLVPQGVVFRRPPVHTKPEIHIAASYVPRWETALERLPDMVDHVEWVSPDPAALGLNAIWLPWGRVAASSLARGAVRQGPLTATFRLSIVTWKLTSSRAVVIPIPQSEP